MSTQVNLGSQAAIIPNIHWNELVIGEPLGNGTFGDVFKGNWRNREVAIKVLKEKTLSPKQLEDFQKETSIMSRCRSEQIVKLLAICAEPGHCSMVLEYMGGGTLFDLLANSRINLPWDLRIKFIHDIAKGMVYLHSNDIIHRDFKSKNILFDLKFNAKITDFGLAKIKGQVGATSTRTKKGEIGTARWRAPELFDVGNVPNKATDVFSFGVVVWEVVTRSYPFKDAQDDVAVALARMKGVIEPVPSDCNPLLSFLIQKCTSKLPHERPPIENVIDIIEKKPPPLQAFPLEHPHSNFPSGYPPRVDRNVPHAIPVGQVPYAIPVGQVPYAIPVAQVPHAISVAQVVPQGYIPQPILQHPLPQFPVPPLAQIPQVIEIHDKVIQAHEPQKIQNEIVLEDIPPKNSKLIEKTKKKLAQVKTERDQAEREELRAGKEFEGAKTKRETARNKFDMAFKRVESCLRFVEAAKKDLKHFGLNATTQCQIEKSDSAYEKANSEYDIAKQALDAAKDDLESAKINHEEKMLNLRQKSDDYWPLVKELKELEKEIK